MTHTIRLALFATLAACGGSAPEAPAPPPEPEPPAEEPAAAEAEPEAPSFDEQLAGLRKMCEDAGPAMKARQEATSLYDRIGGEEKIRAFVTETIRIHNDNPPIADMFGSIDQEKLIAHVTDFLNVGTGGPGEYTGRDMKTAHAHLKISTEQFLAARDDLEKALGTTGVGADEAQEVNCAFVGLSGEVIATM